MTLRFYPQNKKPYFSTLTNSNQKLSGKNYFIIGLITSLVMLSSSVKYFVSVFNWLLQPFSQNYDLASYTTDVVCSFYIWVAETGV